MSDRTAVRMGEPCRNFELMLVKGYFARVNAAKRTGQVVATLVAHHMAWSEPFG